MICVRRALRHQVALVQEQHLVGDLLHHAGVVLHHQQRLAFRLQPAQQRHDRVQRAGATGRRPARPAAAAPRRWPARARRSAASARRRTGCAPSRRARSARPTCSRVWRALSRAAALRARRVQRTEDRAERLLAELARRPPTSTLSSAVRSANSRRFWKVRAMPACTIACGRSPSSLRPRNVTLPVVRAAGSR